jgi:integrase/recombinase XerC
MPEELVHLDAPDSPIALALVAWLEAKRKRSNSKYTERDYVAIMSSFQAALAQVGLDLDSDPTAVAMVAQAWAGQGETKYLAAASHNKRLGVISSFYTFARKRGLLVIDNPIQRVDRRPVQDYAKADALTPDEVRSGLEAIDRSDLAGKRDYVVLSVALITGRRLSEIAGLRWGDVRLGRNNAVTLQFKAKGAKIMRDALPGAVSRTLIDYLQAVYERDVRSLPADAPLWVSLSRQNYGAALHSNWLERIARRRLAVNFHALRHTFARTLEDAGAKVSDIQARLGHESLNTTGRYLAALRRAENPLADKLASMFGFGRTDDGDDV